VGNDFKDLFGDWRPGDEAKGGREGALPEAENRTRRALNEKEVKVINVFEGVIEGASSSQPPQTTTFVLLKDNHGRKFRIFVVRDVAVAISMALDTEAPDRPLTHDLVKGIIDRLGASVERVTIDDLWQDTFYARITLTRGTETFDLDSRPSDAIAMALRYHAPIYVAEAVLEAANQATE
jgi:bifunctional DNase/RNase